MMSQEAVSYTHLRAHETVLDLVCRLLLENKNKNTNAELLIKMSYDSEMASTGEQLRT